MRLGLKKECDTLHKQCTELTQERVSLLESKSFLQEKLSRLSDNMADRVAENEQMVAHVERQRKEIMVRNTNVLLYHVLACVNYKFWLS